MAYSYTLAITEHQLNDLLKAPTRQSVIEILSLFRYDNLASIACIPFVYALLDKDNKLTKEGCIQLDVEHKAFTKAFLGVSPGEIAKLLAKQDLSFPRLNTLVKNNTLKLTSQKNHDEHSLLNSTGHWQEQFPQITPELLRNQVPGITTGGEVFIDDQARILSTLLRNEQDPLTIQGYTGSGKSLLAKLIIEGLIDKHKAYPVYLSKNKAQTQSLQSKLSNKNVAIQSFNQLIYHELDAGNVWGKRNNYKSLTGRQVAKYMSLQPIGAMSPEKVGQVLNSTITSFCLSGDWQINNDHLPFHAMVNQSVLIELCNQYWKLIISSGASHPIPVEWMHRMKLLSIKQSGFTKKLRYTHIIVDEAQDLPTPVKMILRDTKIIPVIKMKDEMQNLSYKKTIGEQTGVRSHVLTQSARQGKQIMPILNDQIFNYNEEFSDKITSADLASTHLQHIEKLVIPNKPTTFLCQKSLTLLKIVRLLHRQSKQYSILPTSFVRLKQYLNDLISLQQGRPYLVKTQSFHKFKSWSDFKNSSEANGLGSKHYKFLENQPEVLSFINALDSKNSNFKLSNKDYIAGFAEDSKSLEFDNVMLLADLWSCKENEELKYISRTIYIAASRATKQLYIPNNELVIKS